MGNEIGIQTKNRLSKSMLPEKHPQFENYICLVKGKKKKIVVKSWHGKLVNGRILLLLDYPYSLMWKYDFFFLLKKKFEPKFTQIIHIQSFKLKLD